MNTNEATNAVGGIPSENPEEGAKPAKARRGFAAMDRDKVREIASKGGKAAHEQGTAHQFTSEEAREAGKRGGIAPHRSRGRRPVAAAEVANPGPVEMGAQGGAE